MTALAMILGMLPMSLALGAGGEQNAPLGRAVIGGLIAATFMTLIVIPIVYSFFGGARVSKVQRDAQIRRVLEQTEAARGIAVVIGIPLSPGLIIRMSGNPKSREASTVDVFFVVAWIGLAVVTLIAALAVVTVRGQAVRSQTDLLERQAKQGQPVLVTTLVGRPETREISLPGEVHGYYETPIYAKIAGYVMTMLVDKGSRVRAGQLVATIESPETDQQTRNAKASYEIAAITDRRYQALLRGSRLCRIRMPIKPTHRCSRLTRPGNRTLRPNNTKA